MKIEPQSSTELIDLAKRVEGIDVVMMTTLSLDDSLVSRPMSPIETRTRLSVSSKYWFGFRSARSL